MGTIRMGTAGATHTAALSMSLLFEHWPGPQLVINQNSLELPAP